MGIIQGVGAPSTASTGLTTRMMWWPTGEVFPSFMGVGGPPVPALDIGVGTEIAMQAVLKRASQPSATGIIFQHGRDFNGHNRRWLLILKSDGTFAFQDINHGFFVTSTGTFRADNTNFRVTLTRSTAGVWKFYLDSDTADTTVTDATVVTADTDGNFRIGDDNSNDNASQLDCILAMRVWTYTGCGTALPSALPLGVPPSTTNGAIVGFLLDAYV